jgi:hypothetical protein
VREERLAESVKVKGYKEGRGFHPLRFTLYTSLALPPALPLRLIEVFTGEIHVVSDGLTFRLHGVSYGAMGDQGASRRRHPRYQTDLDIIIYQGQSSIHARIRQISRGGCLILPPLPPLPDEPLRMSFRLEDDAPYINCKGEVVYSFGDRGTGVAFTEISIYNQDLITKHFEKQPAAEGQATG